MKKVLTLILLSAVLLPSLSFAKVKAETSRGVNPLKAQEIQTKIQELKAANETQKEAKRAEVLEAVKEKATNSIDRTVAKYERTKTRIGKMPVISEERKTELEAKIDAEIEKIEAYKPKVEAALTVAEVKTVMADLKAELKSSLNVVKEAVKAIHATHLDNIITRLTEILEKLETKVANATGDKTEMETLVTNSKTFLASAKTKTGEYQFKEAKEDILSARKEMIELAQKLKAENQTEGEEE